MLSSTSNSSNSVYDDYFETISRQLKSIVDGEMRKTIDDIKAVCDMVIASPSINSLSAYNTTILSLPKEAVQGLQQYLFYPINPLIKKPEIKRNVELHLKVLSTVQSLLEKIIIHNFDMFLHIESNLLSVIFDSSKPGMISEATEEVKYSTIKCLTVLMLNLHSPIKEKLLKTQVPVLAQVVFVSVHIAKLEKLRVLRLVAIDCVMAHTMTHPKMTTDYRIPDPELELLLVDNLLSSILPGVLGALQDVAVCTNNPGHAVITAAIEATHRVLCLTMHDKYLVKENITVKDFVKAMKQRRSKEIKNPDVSNKEKKDPRDMEKRSQEWFDMAGEKLTLITQSLYVLRTYDHYKVRLELAIFYYRVLTECSTTMSESIPTCLDVLISLTKDSYKEVSDYCSNALESYFKRSSVDTMNTTMDRLCDNFLALLTSLPRILNDIDSTKKESALNLLHGYIETLSGGDPPRLHAALTSPRVTQQLCDALTYVAQHQYCNTLVRRTAAVIAAPPPLTSPWSVLHHLDSPACITRLQLACATLGSRHCSNLLLDVLLQRYTQDRDAAAVYVMNWMAKAKNPSPESIKRILNAYLEDEIWYSPIEVEYKEVLDETDTMDVTVYNPRAWLRDSVPGLYEGTVETRYTDIPLQKPSLRHTIVPSARITLTRGCLVVEGVGTIAVALKDDFQPYLLRTLCLVLEKVGSEYELLHLAGLKAINDIALSGGHASVCDLIRHNADYFTNQITVNLKKTRNVESALQILSVVMEYSDVTMFDCLYGIVDDVLVQSCDKFYVKNINSYLQVFLTFIECVLKWYPHEDKPVVTETSEIDLLKDVEEYVRNTQEAERWLSESEDLSGKSAEDLYKEDLKNKEEMDPMDYDDTVAPEKPPLPLHIKVTIAIIKRAIHFIPSPNRDTSILSLQVSSRGLKVLAHYEDELLPLVHLLWDPLVTKFGGNDHVTTRNAFDLLVVMAELCNDFIRSRALKDVLPGVLEQVRRSAKESYLKDSGAAYRASAAYRAQRHALAALGSLAARLQPRAAALRLALACLRPFLSNRQPKPLQEAAVNFFKTIMLYDYGAVWDYFREFCDNSTILTPPTNKHIKLETITGTPYEARYKEFDANVKLIFDVVEPE